jgi:hypothetical protein
LICVINPGGIKPYLNVPWKPAMARIGFAAIFFFTRVARYGRGTAIVACMIAAAAPQLAAQDLKSGQAGSPAEAQSFEIPAQALNSALNLYIRATGTLVLYETSLTAGRRSARVQGSLSREAALEMLLKGTGLSARRTEVDAFVILPDPGNKVSNPVVTAVPDRRFLSALQSGVLDVLCRNPQARPGGYNVAVELWIDSTGTVRRSALIGSTGDTARDAILIDTLRSASIGLSPPPGLPQPFILKIGPRPPKETGDCTD